MRMNIIKQTAATLPIMALAAALATSCSSDSIAEGTMGTEEGTVTFTATVEGDEAGSRVGFSKDESNATTAKFYWNNGDQILLRAKSSAQSGTTNYSLVPFTTSCADGSTTATFSSNVLAQQFTFPDYAVYPYSKDCTYLSVTAGTGNVYATYTLPATYDSYTVGSNVFPKDGKYPNCKIPLLGVVNNTNKTINFKQVAGLLVIRIDKMTATQGTLTVTADEKLSGKFQTDNLSFNDNRTITTTSTGTESEKTVTFNFTGATQNEPGVFYLPVATGTYSNVTIKQGETTLATETSIQVNRGSVKAIAVSTTNSDNQ